jgi:8-oxo-dGTP diphosphatase
VAPARNSSSATAGSPDLNLGKPIIHVVAGILRDNDGRVLLTQRPSGKHLAGLWEFPGGKREPGESSEDALRRELHEEIGIDVGAMRRVICFPWDYAEKSIFLDVYDIADFSGIPHGREGQALRWEYPDDLLNIPVPAADVSIVSALRLPDRYAITPEPHGHIDAFLAQLGNALQTGIKLVQLRCKHMPTEALSTLAAQALAIIRRHDARLMLSGNVDVVRHLQLDGIHLPAAELMRCTQRPLDRPSLVGASCHDAAELDHAVRIGADFAVLGPVTQTDSHPNVQPLGWSKFSELCMNLPMPVYALGGMAASDLPQALNARAQGIAGISAFWDI